MSPESLPVKLRQARGSMSIAEAAVSTDIPEDRIRMYEEGVRRPYGKTLRRLADAYGVRVGELLGTGQMIPRRGRAPETRRRRRRVTAEEGGGAVVTIPVEVEEGQTIRLVIELVVHPRGVQATVQEADDDVEAEQAPPPPREEPAGAAVTPFPRRFAAVDEAGRQPRDPIVDLKRAYQTFRQKKR